MDIYPQDLGPGLESLTLQIRQEMLGHSTHGPLWLLSKTEPLHDTDSERLTSRKAVRQFAWRHVRSPIIWGGLFAFIFGGADFNFSTAHLLLVTTAGMAAGGTAGFSCAQWRCRRILQAPLKTHEMGLITRKAADPLLAEYCGAITMLVSMPSPGDRQTERNMRQSALLLGQAVESLPPPAPMHGQTTPKQLQMESAAYAAEARGEEDPVVAASYERRAKALAQQAVTVAQTQKVSRRHQVLRDEIAGQIKALRTNAQAWQLSGKDGAFDLSELAASIAQVAQETAAVAKARSELEDAAPQAFVQQRFGS